LCPQDMLLFNSALYKWFWHSISLILLDTTKWVQLHLFRRKHHWLFKYWISNWITVTLLKKNEIPSIDYLLILLSPFLLHPHILFVDLFSVLKRSACVGGMLPNKCWWISHYWFPEAASLS
jgi:hypothetical protein